MGTQNSVLALGDIFLASNHSYTVAVESACLIFVNTKVTLKGESISFSHIVLKEVEIPLKKCVIFLVPNHIYTVAVESTLLVVVNTHVKF